MPFRIIKKDATIERTNRPEIAGMDAVLKTLIYFDIFNYPLTRTEIKKYLCLNTDEISLSGWLATLEAEKKIFFYSGYYSLQNNPLLTNRRIKGNMMAEKLLKKAVRNGRFLYRFPFVRAVGVSGSLSKNYADENSDIDFFIITKRNRLWIARSLMHLFKKLTFITGSQHYYCMNYYIDEEAFPLEDRNIFSAIELKTLVPLCGAETINEFFAHNPWADEYFPACGYRKQVAKEPGKTWLKRAGEWLLKGKAGDSLENFLMKLTQKRWKKKQKQGVQNCKGQAMGLISGKHFARSNPGGLQEKILTAYVEKTEKTIRVKQGVPFFISSVK